MKDKKKVIPVIVCVVIVVSCMCYYISFLSELHYRISPYDYSPITGYEAQILDEIPEGYLISDGTMYDGPEEMKVVEITYHLSGVINDTMTIVDNLCYYNGENGEWIYRLRRDEEYWGEIGYYDHDILPAGEHAVYKEYVLVPRDMEQFKAYRTGGENEELLIEL